MTSQGNKEDVMHLGAGGQGMTALQLETAFQLMGMLLGYQEAGPFRKPVDWKALGLLDYPSIIKRPMDLGTVRDKLRTRAYDSMSAWMAHMALIWANCRLYNGPEHKYSQMADRLEAAQHSWLAKATAIAAQELEERSEVERSAAAALAEAYACLEPTATAAAGSSGGQGV